jgi:hypothetical protein
MPLDTVSVPTMPDAGPAVRRSLDDQPCRLEGCEALVGCASPSSARAAGIQANVTSVAASSAASHQIVPDR